MNSKIVRALEAPVASAVRTAVEGVYEGAAITEIASSAFASARSKIAEEVTEALGQNASGAYYLQRSKPELSSLVEAVAPGLKVGRWQTILGDDVSGRPVAQLLWNQARYLRSDGQIARVPHLRFIAGGFHGVEEGGIYYPSEKASNLVKRVGELQQKTDLGRVLLVTEHIGAGRSLNHVTDALSANGLKFDIAGVRMRLNPPPAMSRLDSQTSFYMGSARDVSGVDPLYSRTKPRFRAAIGVEKWGNETTVRAVRNDQAEVNSLRNSLSELSRAIYTEVF